MASSRPLDLPDFDEPPVAEVVVGVQFQALPQLRTTHLGVLWTQLRDEFPIVEEHVPVDTPTEQFENRPPTFEVQLLGSPPVPRQFFVSADGARLIQVQQDRFLHNWRRFDPASSYPHYEALRESFVKNFTKFADLLAMEDLGEIVVTQAEVTYVNPILPSQSWRDPAHLEDVFRGWTPTFGEGLRDEVEDVRIVQRHRILDEEGNPYARLMISVEPYDTRLVLNLTVRGKPRGGTTMEDALAFFDMGRERIVRAFAAVTTEAMHDEWKRIQ